MACLLILAKENAGMYFLAKNILRAVPNLQNVTTLKNNRSGFKSQANIV